MSSNANIVQLLLAIEYDETCWYTRLPLVCASLTLLSPPMMIICPFQYTARPIPPRANGMLVQYAQLFVLCLWREKEEASAQSTI
jgi:hypothetical protein